MADRHLYNLRSAPPDNSSPRLAPHTVATMLQTAVLMLCFSLLISEQRLFRGKWTDSDGSGPFGFLLQCGAHEPPACLGRVWRPSGRLAGSFPSSSLPLRGSVGPRGRLWAARKQSSRLGLINLCCPWVFGRPWDCRFWTQARKLGFLARILANNNYRGIIFLLFLKYEFECHSSFYTNSGTNSTLCPVPCVVGKPAPAAARKGHSDVYTHFITDWKLGAKCAHWGSVVGSEFMLLWFHNQ